MNIVNKILLAFFLLCCPLLQLHGQSILKLDRSDTLPDRISYKNTIIYLPAVEEYPSESLIYDRLKLLISDLREEGYLEASLDSLVIQDSFFNAYLHIGKQYLWVNLSFKTIPQFILSGSGIKEKEWINRHISPSRYADLCNKIITYCENNGYPFASISLIDLIKQKDGVSAQLKLDQGKEIKIDSIILKGNVDISKDFLLNYLGIKQGDLYNEQQLRMISKRINELSFLEESHPWQMHFTIFRNELIIYLKKKRANQINGLIGLQPNTYFPEKIMFTADILINLKNALGYGESFSLSYKNLQYKSPRFNFEGITPYLLGTPFGIEGIFDLFTRDTVFQRITFDIGIRHQFTPTNYIKLGYLSIDNRLGVPDTSYVKEHKKLPENIDSKLKGAILALHWNKTDYLLNPSKGWSTYISVNALTRRVVENHTITELNDGISGFDYSKLYENFKQEKYQYRFSGNVNYYYRIIKNLVLKMSYEGGYISGQNLFMNELYQIGGFKLLRGFEEQSIYANQYHVGSLDIRLYIDKNSYFYLFSDNAFVRSSIQQNRKTNYPVSLGLGISLENKSGVFNIAAGIGKNSGEIFELKRTRIHFGYAAFF